MQPLHRAAFFASLSRAFHASLFATRLAPSPPAASARPPRSAPRHAYIIRRARFSGSAAPNPTMPFSVTTSPI
jgi:hypothetical protein